MTEPNRSPFPWPANTTVWLKSTNKPSVGPVLLLTSAGVGGSTGAGVEDSIDSNVGGATSTTGADVGGMTGSFDGATVDGVTGAFDGAFGSAIGENEGEEGDAEIGKLLLFKLSLLRCI